MSSEIHSFLDGLYRDPESGFVSERDLYRRAKLLRPSIRLKDVTEWYSKQADIQRLSEQRKKLSGFKITSRDPDSWQIDLMFIDGEVVLSGVNINSRIGYARILESKRASSVLKGLRDFTETHKPSVITSDNGSEFMNKAAQEFFKSNDITHYNNEPGDHNTLGKIERFNRTIKQRLLRSGRQLTRALLDSTIRNYNDSYHRAIGAKPNEMKGVVMNEDTEHNLNLLTKVSSQFSPGERVRYRLPAKTFGKESLRWSETVYEVVDLDGNRVRIRSKNNHTLYKPHNDLKKVPGEATDAEVTPNQIYEVEAILSHKKQKDGRFKYLIKWRGYDEPTWEPQSNLRLINKNAMSQLEKDYFERLAKKK